MGNSSSNNEIKLGEKIGHGAYGEVFKAVWQGKPVAAKRIYAVFFEGDEDGSTRDAFLKKFKSEWEILSTLQHKNIVKYHTVILPPTPETPMIITELLDCDLAKFMRQSTSKPRVSFTDTVKIMLDVAEGLNYLHSQEPPIVHRDLASKNILLTKDLHAKIADLGLAKAFPHGAMFATAMPGTPVYAAPETFPSISGRKQFDSKAVYSEKVDVFSFGAMMLETIIGHLPNRLLPDPVLEDGEIVPEYIRRSEELEEMGPDHPLHNLVCRCLENIPDKRPNAAEIIEKLLKVSKRIEGIASVSLPREKVGPVAHIHYDHKFKVLILGESDVGKTSIIMRFLDPNSSFPDIPHPYTIATEDHFERLRFRNKSVHLHLVDVGECHFSTAASFMPQIFRRVRGAVVVFDVTSEVSFLEVRRWLDVLNRACQDKIPLVLVGNKTDDPERWVNTRSAQSFAHSRDMFYVEASAKKRDNIDEIFSILLDLMIQREEGKASKSEKPSSSVHQLTSLGSLDGTREGKDEALIAERTLTPRRDAVDVGVITLDDGGQRPTGGVSENGEKGASNLSGKPVKEGSFKCCVLI